MRAPLAPPRMSEPRKVRALSQAVATLSAIDRSLAAIFAFAAATSQPVGPFGTGSCQIRSSFGTSGPT